MFAKILSFEIRYRLRRPATYAYFMILFLMTFFAVISENLSIGEASSLVHRNSPYSINLMVQIMMIFGTMIISAVMGVPVYRDFEYGFHEIMYTTPIKKWEYLAGRFFGSYLITLFIFSGLLFGIWFGSVWPDVSPEKLGPNAFSVYLQPFLIYIVPNCLMLGALFFAMGSLFRNQLAIYVQGVILFALYLIIVSNQRDIDNNRVFSLFDPFGFSATSNITRYWTTVEKNTTVIPLEGLLMWNRLIWIAVAILISAVFYRLFKFSKAGPSLKKKKALLEDENIVLGTFVIPAVTLNQSLMSKLKQWWYLVKFDFKGVIRAVPFIAITLCGVLILFSNSTNLGSMYGTTTYPVTYMILDMLTGNFILFIIIIITFYSGELLWKEINARLAPIIDSTPLSNHLILTAKFTSMIMVELLLLLVLMLSGIIMQTVNGFYDYQIPVYLKSLLLNTFPYLVLITLLTFLIHALVNNKFLGHVIVIIFWLGNLVLAAYDIDHNLLWYGNTPAAQYSAMNGFGHFVFPILMFDAYWLMLGIIFFMIGLLMMKRGSEIDFRSRVRVMKATWKAGAGKLIIPVALVLFILCGGFIYYNTNVLNKYQSPKKQRTLTADYEKKYKKYSNTPQPRITAVNVNVDLFPYERACEVKGTYIIKNKNTVAVDSVIMMVTTEGKINEMAFGIQSQKVLEDNDQGFYIYKLDKPLMPGDSTTLTFNLSYAAKGFENSGGNTAIVYNGTFINNGLLPSFGYAEGNEIENDERRKEMDLPKKPYRMNLITDTAQYKNTYLGQDADWIRYEAIVSTAIDQIAISPGYLQKEWTEGNRRYFHYKMDSPIWNFYSFLSARYEVLRDKHNGVNIEIYYQKGHEYDLKQMVKGIKLTLDYCGKNFSPYQHKQVRIIEFPRYDLFAQSFPNTIPFSEGIGFIMDVDKETDIDMAFYVTSHEVAHQWWGHQVCGANVQGSTMIVESMAQYSALMVMEHEYGKDNMHKFLKYEMDSYLRGRAGERKREQPLMLNENQQYIHYRKGSVVFYALKDYIGEDSLNTALSRFVKNYAFKDGPYPTGLDFVRYLKAATPDSMQSIISDLFETITLFNNKAETVSSEKLSDGKYKVTLDISTAKMRADSVGGEKPIAIKDWIDVGVYAKDKSGKDSLVYLHKYLINQAKQQFEIIVTQQPTKAGIDPLHKLIDRNTGDNVKTL